MLHYNLVHTFIPIPHVMKIPDAKAAMDKECKKFVAIPAESQKQEGGHKRGTN